MSKFNTGTIRPATFSPIQTEVVPSGPNHYGTPGHSRSAKSELFLLAVANMVSQDTFYEQAKARDSRYVELIRSVTIEDQGWVAAFLPWLRKSANMRSASIVGAAEHAKACLDNQLAGSRSVVAGVQQRADEPGELLAYWTSKYGRALPKPVKRGIADGAARLYNERSLLKYDAAGKGYRFGDVLELVHAENRTDWQGDLFRHAIDRRHNRDNPIPESLSVLRNRDKLMGLPVAERRALLAQDDVSDILLDAGMTWEALAGWLQGPMDAEAWSAAIPSMGYMARLRNLRNFDEAGLDDERAGNVAEYLADPGQVAKSRQFPFRFLSAHRAVPSLRWGHALEKALQASLANVPALSGRTLIVVDRSPSMFPGYHFSTVNSSDMSCADQAAVFGVALALRASAPTLVLYGGESREVSVPKAGSLLRVVDSLGQAISYTDTAGAVRRHYSGHDRVVIVTDEQTATADVGSVVPDHVPVYTWNLAGYQKGHGQSGSTQRHTFGGLTDQAFSLISLLEAGHNAAWPWEQSEG